MVRLQHAILFQELRQPGHIAAGLLPLLDPASASSPPQVLIQRTRSNKQPALSTLPHYLFPQIPTRNSSLLEVVGTVVNKIKTSLLGPYIWFTGNRKQTSKHIDEQDDCRVISTVKKRKKQDHLREQPMIGVVLVVVFLD